MTWVDRKLRAWRERQSEFDASGCALACILAGLAVAGLVLSMLYRG